MWQPSNLQEKSPSGQTRHWRYQLGRMTQRLNGEEEEESDGLARAPSHSEGQQEHLCSSPQNLINLSAPTDPNWGDLCTYKHLCLQFFNTTHTHVNPLLRLLSRSSKLPFPFFHLLEHIIGPGGADCLALAVFFLFAPIPFS